MLVMLTATFLTAGMIKIVQSKEKLSVNLPWTEDFSPGTLKFLGVVEVLGALGLFLPEVTSLTPIVTPLAAVGMVLMMSGASIVHVRRRERFETGVTLVVLVVAVAVAWGRFGPYSL
jgi:hypothetical protein